MKATIFRKIFHFLNPAKTSKSTLHTKTSYFLKLENYGRVGWGECSLLSHLSPEMNVDLDSLFAKLCTAIEKKQEEIIPQLIYGLPAVQMMLEMAMIQLNHPKGLYFSSGFQKGEYPLEINGLIWMGDLEYQKQQAKEHVAKGQYHLKCKIGAREWMEDIRFLHWMRSEFGDQIQIKVDANGAYSRDFYLKEISPVLSKHSILSIEQPIAVGNWKDLAEVAAHSQVPIALDEELITTQETEQREHLLSLIPGHSIVLKASLVGGFMAMDEWVSLAKSAGVSYWMTSALESNLGLQAIAQYCGQYAPEIRHGLGTGALYGNNTPTQLRIEKSTLWSTAEEGTLRI